MAKTHSSLSPTANIFAIMAWGTVAVILFLLIEPTIPLAIGIAGMFLGAVGGVMQHLSFRQATDAFAHTSSLLDVRKAFTSTSWGSRYISWLYLSKIVLAIIAFFLIRHDLIHILLGYLAGYMSLMFARELVTLRDTFYLQRLTDKSGDHS